MTFTEPFDDGDAWCGGRLSVEEGQGYVEIGVHGYDTPGEAQEWLFLDLLSSDVAVPLEPVADAWRGVDVGDSVDEIVHTAHRTRAAHGPILLRIDERFDAPTVAEQACSDAATTRLVEEAVARLP